MEAPMEPDPSGNTLAERLGRAGRWQELEEWARFCLSQDPQDAEAHNHLGIALQNLGDPAGAVACLRRALTLRSPYPAAALNLGNALQTLGQLTEAIECYQQVLPLLPHSPELRNNLAQALLQSGDPEAAKAQLEHALSLRPDDPATLNRLGQALLGIGDGEGALERFQQALSLSPDEPGLLCNLGTTLQQLERDDEAIHYLNQALSKRPDFAEAYNTLGVILHKKGDFQQASEALQEAIKLKPDYADPHSNLGNILMEVGDVNLGLAHYRQAIALCPNHADAHNNFAHALLLCGHYPQGWQEYEWRRRCEIPFLPHAQPATAMWDGGALAPGETLLLVSEQGLGDTLQFLRYLQPLRALGVQVRLCAPTKLHGLIRAAALDPDPLSPEAGNAYRDGPWLPLLSLPGLLGVTPHNPLVVDPYLRIPPEAIPPWRSLLASEGQPLIGLHWQGNPKQETGGSRGRSLPLEAFAPLAAEGGIALVSLQKGPGSEQLEACSFRHRFVPAQKQVDQTWDFLDTAAIVACCDLVITSDSALAHLSAGLGHPTWLLLKDRPDWRWGLEGDSTFWYPSMRLFRQRQRGDWQEVIRRVSEELSALRDLQAMLALAATPSAPGTYSTPGAPPPAADSVLWEVARLIEAGELDPAERLCREGIDRSPADPRLLTKLAVICGRRGRWQELEAWVQRSLALHPEQAEAHNALGLAQRQAGHLDAAIVSYRTALALQPTFAAAHNNLGIALQERGDLAAAAESYTQAITLRTDFAEAHTNLAMLLLLQGEYGRGWQEYEWRHARSQPSWGLLAKPRSPRWDGGPVGPGEELLLLAEQGLGDTVQFMRYALPLQQRGIAVRLSAPANLHSLIRSCGLDAAPLTPAQAEADWTGKWLPLLSLPGLLGVSPATPLITAPHLRPEAERMERWQALLRNERRPIVALAWQGNPSPEETTLRGRPLPLETLRALAERSEGTFLSLQKGFGSEQLEGCSFRHRFVRAQDAIDEAWDFRDAAALLACCDQVITTDTVVAHLAGGLGLPAWLLLHHFPDWRWGLEGDSTFWYPSLRLFRQRRPGDWPELVARVAEALGQWQEPEAILAPISLGELIDKITILEIKSERLQGAALANVRRELAALREVCDRRPRRIDPALIDGLRQTNRRLWEIEDAIREQERRQDFGEAFVQLARSVYQQNDRRAALKRRINTACGSALIEEKSYADYGSSTDP
jgi:Flp pilus assembly protein TadD/ADP-heptose:LPS heptosyltransferase